jgi:hypothetical protein
MSATTDARKAPGCSDIKTNVDVVVTRKAASVPLSVVPVGCPLLSLLLRRAFRLDQRVDPRGRQGASKEWGTVLQRVLLERQPAPQCNQKDSPWFNLARTQSFLFPAAFFDAKCKSAIVKAPERTHQHAQVSFHASCVRLRSSARLRHLPRSQPHVGGLLVAPDPAACRCR